MANKQSDLKKFFETKKHEKRLLGHVERHILSRPPGDRSTTVLHPSEIIKRDWCKRASYFLLRGHKKIAEKPPLRLQSIFDEGHYIHAKWQGYFQEMGVLHGSFTCTSCGWQDFDTSPKLCTQCGAKDMRYDEVTLFDDELRIAGHTDGWIKGIGEDCLIEIKSIGPGTIRNESSQLMYENNQDVFAAWKSIRRPFSSHLLQGQMYLELINRMGHDINEIVFLYEFKADQDYKEFTVKRDYELVAHIFGGAERVVEAVKKQEPLECSNNPGGTCKDCQPYSEEADKDFEPVPNRETLKD